MGSGDITAIISEREKEWMQAWIEKDERKLREILADDFLLASARGVFMTRQEWITNALGPFTCADFQWKEIRVREYDTVAVVNALTYQRAKVGEQDWSGDFMLTDVWVKKNNTWQVVSRQGTGPLKKEG